MNDVQRTSRVIFGGMNGLHSRKSVEYQSQRNGNRDSTVRPLRLIEQLLETRSFDVFEHDERPAIVHAHVMRTDRVRMVNGARQSGLFHESGDGLVLLDDMRVWSLDHDQAFESAHADSATQPRTCHTARAQLDDWLVANAGSLAKRAHPLT